ncbi:hypothetical protein B5G20_04960 [Collinsella sp. An7]|uniref:hypothetical protein n=1 Tax=Collinsella sp. An7 TaxID=1965651 RepID=UPI000B39E437|nr:hypothetical protein [Collinsella sp. An7]OUN47318.1 hypothetical protein B5G20_04960 [Collinsella sp. An7]
MTIRSMKYTADEPSKGQHVEEVHIEGLPSGGSTPGANSITTAMLQANSVTNEKIADGTIQAAKLASGVIPTLPGNASTAVEGVVKMASAVADVAAANATSTSSAETVNPTEFSAVVTLVNECKTKLNALLAAERTAGQLSN